MPREVKQHGDAADWLRHAWSDLVVARQRGIEDVLLGTLCFHAQQSVEKSIKAVFVHCAIPFPYTHDIAALITILEESGPDWPNELQHATRLTRYASLSRYPRVGRGIDEEEYDKAVDIAGKVFEWADQMINKDVE